MVSIVPCAGQTAVLLAPMALSLLLSSAPALAEVPDPDALEEQRESLLVLRNTMVSMIEQLVEEGVISDEQAAAMIERAEIEAREEAARMAPVELAPDPRAQRVSYVPEIVKDQLRDEIMSNLRGEVVQDVLNEARDEAWGVPGALPAWLTDIDWTAEVRIRGQSELYDSGNVEGFYRNFQAINEAGGIGPAGQQSFINVTEDDQTLRGRLRLGMTMRIAPRWRAGLRISTGNTPVSRNVTLGQTTSDFRPVIDMAYLNYRSKYFLFSGGRIPNPFVHSALMWDPDVVFEGVAFTGLLPFRLGKGASTAYVTAGAFPLEPSEFEARDKWLYGGQAGIRFGFENGGGVGLSASYYDFDNVEGIRNDPESALNDFTAPQFLQRGNTLFDIRNDTDPNTGLFALASDYDVGNVTLMFDTGPVMRLGRRSTHLMLTADYIRNFGWDDDEVFDRTGINIDERTDGYQVRLDFGMPSIRERGDFLVTAFFRYLERDATIDAFTESNFLLGGTDAEGWGLELGLGLSRNTWLEMTYITANEIDGPPLGIDVLQFDVNTRFGR